MVKSIRVQMNSAGVVALLRSAEVQADLARRAAAIARAAGEGMEPESTILGDRAVARVWTATNEAREAEATRRALTRAIDAGR